MKALLLVVLIFCLAAGVASDCTSICLSNCKVLNEVCFSKPVITVLAERCLTINDFCNATCKQTFCPCIGRIVDDCESTRKSCRTGGNNVDTLCELQYSACMFGQVATCPIQVGALLISKLSSSVVSFIENPATISAFLVQFGFPIPIFPILVATVGGQAKAEPETPVQSKSGLILDAIADAAGAVARKSLK